MFGKGSAFLDEHQRMFYVEDVDSEANSGFLKVRESHQGANESEYYLDVGTRLVSPDIIRKLVVWVPVSLVPCLPEGCDPRLLTFAYDPVKKEVRV
jgi:hypothetical protein